MLGNGKVHMFNKGNAKRGVFSRLKTRPCDLDLWPWKSIGFQILLRSKYVPSLVKIHWRTLILVFTRMLRIKIWPGDIDLWPWKSIDFQTLLRTTYVPSLVKIYWRMLILECSQGCHGRTDGRKEGRTGGRKEGQTEGWTVALLYPFTTSLARR